MSKELESARSAAIRSKLIGYVVCAIFPLLIAIYAITEEESVLMGVGMFVVFYSMARVLYAAVSKNKAYAQFVSLYKKEMITSALNGVQLYEEINYDFASGINPNVVNGTGMLTTNRFFSDCYMSGLHNGVRFVQADIRNVRGERGGYVLEYDGTFLIVPVNLPHLSETIVFNKKVDISIVLPGKKYKTGNSEFDQTFDVYSNKNEEAATLLTQDFINKLLDVQKRMKSRMAFTIKDGYMYIFLSKHGSNLKPKLWGKYDESARQEIVDELNRAKLIIDAFATKSAMK